MALLTVLLLSVGCVRDYFARFDLRSDGGDGCSEQALLSIARTVADQFGFVSTPVAEVNDPILFQAWNRSFGAGTLALTVSRGSEDRRYSVVVGSAVGGPTELTAQIVAALSSNLEQVLPACQAEFVQFEKTGSLFGP